MSPSALPAQPQTFIDAAPRAHRSAGRRVATVVGACVALLGALLALAGGGLLALFGTGSVAWTGRHDLATPTSALVSGTASIDTGGFVNSLGSARIKIDAQAAGGHRVFVGVGPARDVERYLAGAATDEVTDFDASPFRSGYTIHTRRHPGTAIPAPPARQSFWIARGSSRGPTAVDWKVRDGRYRVVVMNADGGRGVATQTRFAVSVPYVFGLGLGLLIGGVLVLAGGVATVTVSRRRRLP
jgi:hypothetical protein